jgi:pentatricopeptide repeat domain-containing protein 1
MVRRGCERNVITYSSLISACEKAGRWELALDLFREMHTEGCRPNVVTFNSLIAACAQGGLPERGLADRRP